MRWEHQQTRRIDSPLSRAAVSFAGIRLLTEVHHGLTGFSCMTWFDPRCYCPEWLALMMLPMPQARYPLMG